MSFSPEQIVAAQGAVEEYIPPEQQPNILLTTRNREQLQVVLEQKESTVLPKEPVPIITRTHPVLNFTWELSPLKIEEPWK